MTDNGSEIFENGLRYYIDQGEKFPSVTSVMKSVNGEPEGITRWKERTPNWEEITEKSRLEGTVGHYRILNRYSINVLSDKPEIPRQALIDGELLHRVELMEMMWDNITLMQDGQRVYLTPIDVEERVICRKYKYAGRVDMIAEIDGKVTIVDLKRNPDPTKKQYHLQVAAYAMAFVEDNRFYDEVEQGMVVSLCPDERKNPDLTGKYDIINKKDLDKLCDEWVDMMGGFYACR